LGDGETRLHGFCGKCVAQLVHGVLGVIAQEALATPANARSLAVQDTKRFVAYSGEGVHINQDSYPSTKPPTFTPRSGTFDAPDNDKVLVGFDVLMDSLPANTTVKVEYELDRCQHQLHEEVQGDAIPGGVAFFRW
jgi:hypothetical protein